ncbi:TPA: hypothetical protein RV156_001844 [Yersinia enterocolitica]|nr:hypothetical protein [Yersinia enterocolitica]
MKLYIANTTKQRHMFSFRTLETGRLRNIPIAYGSQAIVLDGGAEEIDAVIQHHQVYGLIDASTIDQSKNFVGLCYSIDKPVQEKIIEKAMRDNDHKLTETSHNRRQASVAAQDDALLNSGTGYGGEMEFTVEQTNGRDDNNNTPSVNETIVTQKRGSKK